MLSLPGQAGHDVAGDLDSSPGASADASYPGEGCGTCPQPAPDAWGVTLREGALWVLAGATLYHLRPCGVVEAVPLAGVTVPVGLGYDSRRDVFVVTDPAMDLVHQIDATGAVAATWPSPGEGPVGAAYDPDRDVYWISDWIADSITPLDPVTGESGPELPVPFGSRIAGCGYDRSSDALLYNARDQSLTCWMSAGGGELLASSPNPGGPGINNGRGTAVAPEGRGWLGHFEQGRLYCVEGPGPVGVERVTWGATKAGYR
jgi:hypothetical protein